MIKRRPASQNSGEPGLRTYFNGKSVLLFGLTILLVVSTAIPLKTFLDQKSRIDDLQATASRNEARIAELQKQVDRWQDPAYVKAQARNRLHYVMPNEVGYIVLEADDAEAVILHQTNDVGVRPAWYRALWTSISDAADTAPPLLEEVSAK
ncbi:MAG: hypothetical protein RLZZ330_504 [Actinomycetota bacterium]|jgi:cell division protein FtsB